MQTYFEYSNEVKDAIENRKPILALESTLITHGLPYPHNLETAKSLEAIAREHQVTPATIAIMNGKIKIGLTTRELEELVHSKPVFKASKCDIPYLLSQNFNAGTTVAATLFCADAAGIKFFATGGIGGVHHGDAGDISADLIELAHTPVAVICAGAKAILDLPRTLEYLETHSVPVVGYRTKRLPAFYSADSSHALNQHVDDVPALAKLLKIHWDLSIRSGILITNPIPAEDEIPAELMQPVIADALQAAVNSSLSGKEVTPFLLSKIAGITKGKSMTANISLIKKQC